MTLRTKLLLYLLMSIFVITSAQSQIYEPGKTQPVLGEIQDGGITGCIELTDTETMVLANMTGVDAKSVWLELLKEEKCGTFNLPFFYERILGEFQLSHKTAYVVSVRVKLDEWAQIYTFVPFKPLGLQHV